MTLHPHAAKRRLPWLGPPSVLLTIALAFATSTASAQEGVSNDFLAGRLFQIATEVAPHFNALDLPTYTTVELGGSQVVSQSLEPGFCYVWLAVGDNGTGHIDLAAAVDGQTVAFDDRADDWPILQYCTAQAVEVSVTIQVHAGTGAIAFNTYNRRVGGADQIELAINLNSAMIAVDSRPLGPLTRGDLIEGGELRYPVALTEGQCYSFIGAGGPGVVDLDILLADPSGEIVERDFTPDTAPIVVYCPELSGDYLVYAQMIVGAGPFGWQSFLLPEE